MLLELAKPLDPETRALIDKHIAAYRAGLRRPPTTRRAYPLRLVDVASPGELE